MFPIDDMKIFKDKFALVTGASSGMGKDYAQLLAEAGCNLVLVARRENLLRELEETLGRQYNVQVHAVALDLAAPQAPALLFDDLKSKQIRIDVLINNAGSALYGDFLDSDWEEAQNMLWLDIVALTHLTKIFAADMTARNGGHILLVASIAGFQPSPSYAVYAAAKAYVLNLGEALAYEFRKNNIKVTVLSPGATETEFFKVAGQEVNIYQRLSMMKSRTVAEIALLALAKGKPSIVPGLVNRMIVWGERLIPRRMMPAIASSVLK